MPIIGLWPVPLLQIEKLRPGSQGPGHAKLWVQFSLVLFSRFEMEHPETHRGYSFLPLRTPVPQAELRTPQETYS